MKFFKSSIFAVLGLAVALTACSDDKDHPDYAPAGASAGAYFNAASPKAYYVSDAMTSFDVLVYRTKDAGATFEVSAEDASGLFTVPTTVTFNGSDLTTNITVTFDPSKLVVDQPYPVTLTLVESSGYGQKSYTFNVVKADPMVTESLGAGNYTYYCIWSGDDPDLPVQVSYMPSTPNNLTVTISNWGGGAPLDIEVPDVKNVDASGATTVYVHPQFTGYVHSTYGEVWVADLYSYMVDYFEPLMGKEYQKDPYASFYVPEKGKFSLDMIYFIPKYEKGESYLGNQTYEYFQLDGYPNYDVEVTYDGLFITKDGRMTANATLAVGDDTEEVKAVMVKGKDPQVGLDAIKADGDDVQSFNQTGSFSATFPVTEGGDYTIVVATFGEGELQNAASDSFQITIGDDNADWDNIGTGGMMDGWVMAAFSIKGVPIDVTEYGFQVPIQQHKTDKTLYRLVQPYGPNYPLADNNAYPATRNIQFILDEGIILIQPQLCGFGTTNWAGEMTIGNQAGYILSVNEGATVAQVKNFMIGKGYVLDEYVDEDGYAMINKPWIGAPAIGDGSFGYTWQNPQAAYIFMPDASDEVKALAKAKNVAAPKINGLSQSMRAKKANTEKRAILARSVDTIHPMNLRK